MKKAPFSFETIITIIGVFMIFMIMLSGNVDFVWVLIILGVVCLLYGILGLTKKTFKKAAESDGNTHSPKSLLQIVLGGFIFMLGIVELANIQFTQTFWSVVLIIICVIAVLWFIFTTKNRFKN